MVIEPSDDLSLGAVFEAPMGEIGLPALVRALGREAEPRTSRAFLRLRVNLVGLFQDSPDRGSAQGLPVRDQVCVEGVCARVETVGGELIAQGENEAAHLVGGAVGIGVWAGRARRERGIALFKPTMM